MFQLLIVDDEEAAVEALSVSIPAQSLKIEAIHKAYSARQALKLMEAHPIDIVITDIKMPEMNGLQLIREIQAGWRGTKCILLSGHADFAYAKEAMQQSIEDYLLKPVDDQELIDVVRKVQDKLEIEREEYLANKRITHMLQEHMPLLRNNLLLDLIEGKRLPEQQLKEKLASLNLPFEQDDEVSLLLIRMEEGFSEYGVNSLSLFEYAIGNMAEEIFAEHFHLWTCKDRHDYLIFAVKLRQEKDADQRQPMLERLSYQLQKNIKTYFKGEISVVISKWGRFPEDVSDIWNQLINTVRKMIAGDHGFYMRAEEAPEKVKIKSLHSLYEPPMFLHLLESGRWTSAEEKVKEIFDELEAHFTDSQEHLREVFYVISSAYSYMAHKNGKSLADVLDEEFEVFKRGTDLRFPVAYRDWALRALHKVKEDNDEEKKESHNSIVVKVQDFIEAHLAEDVSLQAIAEHVYLHPVYMAKVYKSVTGESVSDYVFRLRMNKAAFMLQSGNEKVYQIASKLGYRSTPYFIKVFRDHFNQTPQEYRLGMQG